MADFLSGYNDQRRQMQAETAGQLSQLGALQGVLSKARIDALQQQYEQEVKTANTPEEKLSVAQKYMGADKLGASLQTAETHKATIASNKELALARLSQAAQQFDSNYQVRLKAAATDQEKLALAREREVFHQGLARQAAAAGAARDEYNFGIAPQTQIAPTVTAAPPSATGLPANVPPSDAAAYQAALMGGSGTVNRIAPPAESAGMRMDMFGPQGSQGALSTPAPIGALSSNAPAPVVPAPPNNLDARDLMLQRLQPTAHPSATNVVTDADLAAAAQRAGQPSVVPAPVAAPTRKLPQRLIDQNAAKAEAASGESQKSPGAITNEAYAQIITGKMTPGFASWGVSGNPDRNAVANEKEKIRNDLGWTPQEMATKGPENRAKFIALGKVESDLAAIRPFDTMLNTNAKIAVDLAKKIAGDRTNSAFLNKPITWLEANAADNPDIAEYLFQIQTVKTEGARILNNPRLVGQLTDSARHEMGDIVNGNMPLGQTERVLTRMMSDGKNRVNAIEDEANRLKDDIRGSASKPTAGGTPNEIARAVRATGEPYEPAKFDYRIAGDGSIQRKAKKAQ